MQMNKMHRVLAVLLALCMVVGMVPASVLAKSAGNDGSAEMNEAYAARESLMPIGPSFNVDTILEWTPESDPDAAYSRASIQLADRTGGFVVNPVANPEAKLMLCSLANADHDHTSAQGTENFLSWSFNYWQYTDSFVYWSGSQEGLMVVPTGEFTDAAHTNGVPVVATLGFPWGSGAGYVEQVQKFVQKAEDGSFPVADKMIQIMDYYGFDGYFFNQESYGCSEVEGALIEEMMRYMHRMRPDMLISWYDSMLPTGGVSYQDSVNDWNKQFLTPDEDGVVPIDQFFMNYNWNDWKVDTTVNAMKSISRSPYDAFAGVNVQENCMDSWFNDHNLVDEDGLMRISLALYCPNSTLGLSPDGEAFHKVEQEFYTNKVGDPRDDSVNVATSAWAGMSRFFADKTAITKLPFVTDFNSGHGKGYYVNGELSRDREWSYQSIQDIMPTWTWIIDSVGSDQNLTGSYEFDTVYNGGSSIAFEGSLTDPEGQHDVMLYSTDILVEAGQTLELTSMLQNGTPAVSLVLYLDDGSAKDYDSCEKVLLPLSGNSAWFTDSWNLDEYAGKTIKAIGFRMAANGSAVESFKLILGRLAILDKDRRATAAPQNFQLEDILYTDAYKAEARLSWKTVTGASSYLISQVMADGTEQVLMETPNNYFYLPTLIREAGQEGVTLKVAGINRNGMISDKTAELYIPWKYQDGDTDDNTPVTYTNLCLNANIVGMSGENAGEPAYKALDGTSENNSKWCVSRVMSGWLEIDLGEPKTVNRWRVEHGEYGGEDNNTNTSDFSLQYFDEASQTYQTAKSIWGNTKAVTDVILDAPVTAQRWKLNITNSGRSPWAAIRIYEWQMFSEDTLPAPANVPMGNVSCVNNPGAEDTFTMTGAPANHLVRVYRNGELLVEGTTNPEGDLNLNFDLGTAEAGKVQYVVVENDIESPKLCAEFFAEGVASEKAEDVSFALYHQPDSTTAYNFDSTEAYTTMTVSGLAQGDIVRVYEKGAEAAATKQSAPVAANETTATVIGLPVAVGGDTVLMSVQRAGMAESEKYEVTSPAFPGATATVQVFAYNSKGESLTGAQFELVKDGQVTAQVGTTSDSGGKAEVPFGTYTIRCVGVPAGYTMPETEITKIVSIENWIYPITVQVEGEGTVDPEPTDPSEPSEPSEPSDPDLNALVAAAEAAQKAAEEAQAAAEAAQAKAEAAQAAAEEAAASTAADKAAAEAAAQKAEAAQAEAEAAKAAAEAAQTAAEDAAAAAEASNLAAAEEAKKAAEEAAKAAQDAVAAAESAAAAAEAQAAAQSAQQAAEEAAAVAEQAQKDAEKAQAAAEEAAKSTASDKEAAEKAAAEAAAAQKAAEDAMKAAEDAKTAAENSKAAADASNAAAAAAAEEAAKAAKEAADYYQEITEMKAEMAQYLEDTQKAKEAAEEAQKAAEAAQLACAKYYALFVLSDYADEADYLEAQQAELAEAIAAGVEAINAAETEEAVTEALEAAKAVIDAIPTAEDLYLPYTDVKDTDWFVDAVRFVTHNGLMNGMTDTTFAPNVIMDRAMLVTVLYRMEQAPAVTGEMTFTDVDAEDYYYNAVLWAAQNGIVNGITKEIFAPKQEITRQQMVTMLYRFAQYKGLDVTASGDLSAFVDADTVDAYAVEPMIWAVETGLIRGMGAGFLQPRTDSTRAQVATVLMRFAK